MAHPSGGGWTETYREVGARPALFSGSRPILPTLVSVVDDDESVRESLPDLLKVCGFMVHAFSSADEFLASVARFCRRSSESDH
jgi:hypothetical protein